MAEVFPTRYDAHATRAEGVGKIRTGDTVVTKQSFKDECDINRIMARYQRGGVLPAGVGLGRYGDFSEVTDYHQAQFVLERARTQFEALPSLVRDRFKNNPADFLAFVMNPSNKDEARALGLLTEEPVKEPEVKKEGG